MKSRTSVHTRTGLALAGVVLALGGSGCSSTGNLSPDSKLSEQIGYDLDGLDMSTECYYPVIGDDINGPLVDDATFAQRLRRQLLLCTSVVLSPSASLLGGAQRWAHAYVTRASPPQIGEAVAEVTLENTRLLTPTVTGTWEPDDDGVRDFYGVTTPPRGAPYKTDRDGRAQIAGPNVCNSAGTEADDFGAVETTIVVTSPERPGLRATLTTRTDGKNSCSGYLT